MGKRINDLRKRVKHIERQLAEVLDQLGVATNKRPSAKAAGKTQKTKRKVVRTATRGKTAVKEKPPTKSPPKIPGPHSPVSAGNPASIS